MHFLGGDSSLTLGLRLEVWSINETEGICPPPLNSLSRSVPAADIAMGELDTSCNSDYLVIPGGQRDAAAPNNFAAGTYSTTANRFCGRFLAASTTAADRASNGESVCSKAGMFFSKKLYASN